MMKNLMLMRNWGAARTIRLLAGLGLVVLGLLTGGNPAFVLIGGAFVFQAMLNMSCCCGGSSCATGTDVRRIEQYTAGDEDARGE